MRTRPIAQPRRSLQTRPVHSQHDDPAGKAAPIGDGCVSARDSLQLRCRRCGGCVVGVVCSGAEVVLSGLCVRVRGSRARGLCVRVREVVLSGLCVRVRGVACSGLCVRVREVVLSGLCVRVRGVAWPLGRRLAERCRQATDPAAAPRRPTANANKTAAATVSFTRSVSAPRRRGDAQPCAFTLKQMLGTSHMPVASKSWSEDPHRGTIVYKPLCLPVAPTLSEATRSADRLAFRKVAKRAVLEVRLCPCPGSGRMTTQPLEASLACTMSGCLLPTPSAMSPSPPREPPARAQRPA